MIAPDGTIVYTYTSLDPWLHVQNTLTALKAWEADHGSHRVGPSAGTVLALARARQRSPTPSPVAAPTDAESVPAIEFASPTLNSKPQEGIDIVGGWAAVKRDATAAVVCVSFKNVAAVAATHVVFKFSSREPRGRGLGDLELDRRGTFSPGVNIHGWGSLSDWQGGMGHRGYNDNCTRSPEASPHAAALGSLRHVRGYPRRPIGDGNNGVSPP